MRLGAPPFATLRRRSSFLPSPLLPDRLPSSHSPPARLVRALHKTSRPHGRVGSELSRPRASPTPAALATPFIYSPLYPRLAITGALAPSSKRRRMCTDACFASHMLRDACDLHAHGPPFRQTLRYLKDHYGTTKRNFTGAGLLTLTLRGSSLSLRSPLLPDLCLANVGREECTSACSKRERCLFVTAVIE